MAGPNDQMRQALADRVDNDIGQLAEARAAHERMEAAEQFGKIVLTIPG